jgi:DNA-binding response OmpR family regulator
VNINMQKRVLVIDDDKGISEVMRIILEENRYDVGVISDGINIKDRIMKAKPDVILLDIWMSGIDGRDVLKALRKDPKTKHMKVIVISALTNTDKIAADAGADDFLAKPFEISDLLEKVKKYSS